MYSMENTVNNIVISLCGNKVYCGDHFIMYKNIDHYVVHLKLI